jgi:hypothetical protein
VDLNFFKRVAFIFFGGGDGGTSAVDLKFLFEGGEEGILEAYFSFLATEAEVESESSLSTSS